MKNYPGVHVDFTIFCLIFDGEKQPRFLFLGSGLTWNLNLNFQWRKSNLVFKYYHSSAATKSIFWLNSSNLDCLRSRGIGHKYAFDDRSLYTVGLTWRTAHVTKSKKPPLCSEQSSRATDVNLDCMVVKTMFLPDYLFPIILKPENIRKVRKILTSTHAVYMHLSLCQEPVQHSNAFSLSL